MEKEMTNAVDILLVDGPAHGRMICVKRPVTTYIEMLVGGMGIAQYVHREHTYFGTDKKYHVALPPDSVVTDAFIDGTIFTLNFQPAWDLNR